MPQESPDLFHSEKSSPAHLSDFLYFFAIGTNKFEMLKNNAIVTPTTENLIPDWR